MPCCSMPRTCPALAWSALWCRRFSAMTTARPQCASFLSAPSFSQRSALSCSAWISNFSSCSCTPKSCASYVETVMEKTKTWLVIKKTGQTYHCIELLHFFVVHADLVEETLCYTVFSLSWTFRLAWFVVIFLALIKVDFSFSPVVLKGRVV